MPTRSPSVSHPIDTCEPPLADRLSLASKSDQGHLGLPFSNFLEANASIPEFAWNGAISTNESENKVLFLNERVKQNRALPNQLE